MSRKETISNERLAACCRVRPGRSSAKDQLGLAPGLQWSRDCPDASSVNSTVASAASVEFGAVAIPAPLRGTMDVWDRVSKSRTTRGAAEFEADETRRDQGGQ